MGYFNQNLGNAPWVDILIVDPGGFVDSVKFNMRDWSSELASLAEDHQSAFELLLEGIAASDIRTIGRAATLSARLHQSILFNPLFEKMTEICEHIHAAGICRAHSGTIMGFLLEPGREESKDIIEFCRKRFPPDVQLRMAGLIDGGVRYSLDCEKEQEDTRI